MTPVEKLEAAIAKLEAFKLDNYFEWHREPWGFVVWDVTGSPVAQKVYPGHGDLIVTLHRTIDAQLESLAFALDEHAGGLTSGYSRSIALQLADAILGGAE